MKVIIRNETYEVHDPAMVKVDDRGVCPHLLLFSGQYWQRVALTKTDAERAASAIRAALKQGHKHLDLNKRGIETGLPKFRRVQSVFDEDNS